MGEIKVRFKASVKGKSIRGRALVDGGSEDTLLNLNQACELGLNVAHAKIVDREAVGGIKVHGYELSVTVETEGKKARVRAFVPVARETEAGVREAFPRNEEPLIGQDFLQRTGANLNYKKDALEGIGFRRWRRKKASAATVRFLRGHSFCRTPGR